MKCKNCNHKIVLMKQDRQMKGHWTHKRTKAGAGGLFVADYSSHCEDVKDGCKCRNPRPLTQDNKKNS